MQRKSDEAHRNVQMYVCDFYQYHICLKLKDNVWLWEAERLFMCSKDDESEVENETKGTSCLSVCLC